MTPGQLGGDDAAADGVKEGVVGRQAVEEGVQALRLQQLRQRQMKLPADTGGRGQQQSVCPRPLKVYGQPSGWSTLG